MRTVEISYSRGTFLCTKGLQESIHAFEELDVDIGLERILDETTPVPPLDRALSVETEERLQSCWMECCDSSHLQIRRLPG